MADKLTYSFANIRFTFLCEERITRTPRLSIFESDTAENAKSHSDRRSPCSFGNAAFPDPTHIDGDSVLCRIHPRNDAGDLLSVNSVNADAGDVNSRFSVNTGERHDAETDVEIRVSVKFGDPAISASPDYTRGIREFFVSNGSFVTTSSFFDGKTKSGKRFARCERTAENEFAVTLADGTQLRDTVLFDALPYAEIMLRRKMPLLHSSFITVGAAGVLFTGASGAGKTTQALLWQKYRNCEIINGDRSSVSLLNGRPTAHGVPFCGSSGVARKKSVPVGAIVFPVRSHENRAEEMTAGEGARFLAGNFTYLPQWRESADAMWNFIEEFTPKTRFIRLYCTPDERAVSALEKLL